MKVEDDLDVVFARPTDRAVEVLGSTLNVGFTARDIVRPKPDGDPDVVQAGLYLLAMTSGITHQTTT